MLKPLKHVQDLLAHNAELAARLEISDEQLHRLQQENERLKGLKPENERLSEQVMLLQEEVRWFKEQFFGRSSQKSPAEISSEQKMLFNEAELLAAIEAADTAHAARTTTIAEHERKAHSGGREAIPEHLPRKEVLHDLSNAQKYCEHEGVCWAMERIGEEVSERYYYEAPKVWVERQVRPKCACARCHQGVHIAPCAPQILPKSNASPSLLAYLVASKFVDGLPIYRVCQQLLRQGVTLSPAQRAPG